MVQHVANAGKVSSSKEITSSALLTRVTNMIAGQLLPALWEAMALPSARAMSKALSTMKRRSHAMTRVINMIAGQLLPALWEATALLSARAMLLVTSTTQQARHAMVADANSFPPPPMAAADPCKTGTLKCGKNSKCVVKNGHGSCECNAGYTKTNRLCTAMGSRRAAVDRTSLREVETRLTLNIHPSRSGNVVAGVKEQLNNSLMRYSEQHGGIVLAYSNVLLFGRTASILTGLNPYLHVSLSARLLLFAPRPGAFLEGVVNNVGADFIGLLVLGVFNAAVPDQFMRSWQHVEEAATDGDDEDNGQQQHWQHKEDPSHRISVGSRIRLQVASATGDGTLMSIRGSLDDPDTGTPVAPGTTVTVAPSTAAPETSPAPSSGGDAGGKKKKRKVKEGDVSAAAHTATATPPSAVKVAGGKKAKKAAAGSS
ncbi:unnamed protein product [Closterium sp. Yama58-4]|nr:unnamed protein product [Closterium sp. Yama58-4]